ncbi:MAG: diguanylate cyclase [Lachnospiraceae bacterium]|nr:diguanylate cyclase [Lachnospiraceae bacterium]
MTKWIVIVDDDVEILKTAGHVLSKNQMRVTALKSGPALIKFLAENRPDLILLDIRMPEMDGFETLRLLREQETDLGQEETPVVFLTADEDREIEGKSFVEGASDFIRKPIYPEVLLRRIENILNNTEKVRTLTEEATLDGLTGFLNKCSAEQRMKHLCETETGALIVLDLDNFKLINDIYGHEMGDQVLKIFAEMTRRNIRSEDIVGRIGGDEFIVFFRKCTEEAPLEHLVNRLNDELRRETAELVGEEMHIPLGVSAGAVFVPDQGNVYTELFNMADTALYYVKKNGKHGCHVYLEDGDPETEADDLHRADLREISQILEERNTLNHALWLEQNMFSNVYRYMQRYIKSYRRQAYKVLVTVVKRSEGEEEVHLGKLMEEVGGLLCLSLRKSDVMMRSGTNQFFLFLPELGDENVDAVLGRLRCAWERSACAEQAEITFEKENISPEEAGNEGRRGADEKEGPHT